MKRLWLTTGLLLCAGVALAQDATGLTRLTNSSDSALPLAKADSQNDSDLCFFREEMSCQFLSPQELVAAFDPKTTAHLMTEIRRTCFLHGPAWFAALREATERDDADLIQRYQDAYPSIKRQRESVCAYLDKAEQEYQALLPERLKEMSRHERLITIAAYATHLLSRSHPLDVVTELSTARQGPVHLIKDQDMERYVGCLLKEEHSCAAMHLHRVAHVLAAQSQRQIRLLDIFFPKAIAEAGSYLEDQDRVLWNQATANVLLVLADVAKTNHPHSATLAYLRDLRSDLVRVDETNPLMKHISVRKRGTGQLLTYRTDELIKTAEISFPELISSLIDEKGQVGNGSCEYWQMIDYGAVPGWGMVCLFEAIHEEAIGGTRIYEVAEQEGYNLRDWIEDKIADSEQGQASGGLTIPTSLRTPIPLTDCAPQVPGLQQCMPAGSRTDPTRVDPSELQFKIPDKDCLDIYHEYDYEEKATLPPVATNQSAYSCNSGGDGFLCQENSSILTGSCTGCVGDWEIICQDYMGQRSCTGTNNYDDVIYIFIDPDEVYDVDKQMTDGEIAAEEASEEDESQDDESQETQYCRQEDGGCSSTQCAYGDAGSPSEHAEDCLDVPDTLYYPDPLDPNSDGEVESCGFGYSVDLNWNAACLALSCAEGSSPGPCGVGDGTEACCCGTGGADSSDVPYLSKCALVLDCGKGSSPEAEADGMCRCEPAFDNDFGIDLLITATPTTTSLASDPMPWQFETTLVLPESP